jgi:hypothetical protein
LKTAAMSFVIAWLAASACGGGSGAEQPDTTGTGRISTVAALPGVVTDPAGVTVSPDTGVSVLIYYWIPLCDHEQTEEDLIALAAAASPLLLVLPVQPEAASRNFAQTLINDLGISLPVCLADSGVILAVGSGMLPSALLILPDGSEFRETGFGCPARILSFTASVD